MAGKGNTNGAEGNNSELTEVKEGTVTSAPRILRILRMMENEATAAQEEQAFSGDDVADIFEAETKTDMYEADQRAPLNAKDLAGTELEIISVEVKFSNRTDINTIFITPEGKRMYLMIRSCRVRETGDEKRNVKLPAIGEVFQWDTSARFVVAKLLWLYTHGDINPDMGATETVRVVGTDLGGGQEVVKLMPVKPATVSA